MKYYGYIYEGKDKNYTVDSTEYFNTPYEALAAANQKWDSFPDYQIARLLLVLESEGHIKNYAYFQFTSSSACKQFVLEKDNIVWSNPSKQIWNGNATMMK